MNETEEIMSEQMLHLRAPGRWDGVATIVGDREALEALRRAVDAALATGSGGTALYSSDGEGYALAVALENEMCNVQTAYAGETAPVRALREVVPLYAVRHFTAALNKALLMRGAYSLESRHIAREASPQSRYGSAAWPPTGLNLNDCGGVK
jgi:hypothetical protein